MKIAKNRKYRDSKEDRKMQEHIISRANYSLAILGMAFVRHGSGRFLWLGPPPTRRANKRR